MATRDPPLLWYRCQRGAAGVAHPGGSSLQAAGMRAPDSPGSIAGAQRPPCATDPKRRWGWLSSAGFAIRRYRGGGDGSHTFG